MTPETVVTLISNAVWMVILIVGVLVVPGLIVGLGIAIFQAATQINEQTLSFLPRLIVTLLALMLFAHWMTQMMMEFFFSMVERIPQVLY